MDLAADRRTVLTGLGAALLGACRAGPPVPADVPDTAPLVAALRGLEARAQGRLGAHVFDCRTGRSFGWRDGERFAHCSSFKLSLAAMVLAEGRRGAIDPGEVLRWRAADMLPVSPVTAQHLGTGLTMVELARATLITSDNTAANVLLRRLGGPAALTAFWRALGDRVSRLDRYEPELNEVPPGTALDTTTPQAMAQTLARLVHGEGLHGEDRARLRGWMAEVRTGMQRIRAGLPPHWLAGDKTGTGISETRQTYVDIAYAGPPGRAPLIITAYFEPARLVEPMDPLSLGVLADVGRTAARWLEGAGG